jgi:hypothetical protein
MPGPKPARKVITNGSSGEASCSPLQWRFTGSAAYMNGYGRVGDIAGAGAAGAQGLGKYTKTAQRGLRSGNPAVRSLAQDRMSTLRSNSAWWKLSKLGRNDTAINQTGYALGFLSFSVDTLGYYQQGDPLWKSMFKGAIEAGGSIGGGYFGAIAGAGVGAWVFPLDLTGVPVAVGGFISALGGGYGGGLAGNWFATFIFGK